MSITSFPLNLCSGKKLITLILFFSQVQLVLAQESPTFLYRVSGNGLSKPSYLLGSIHLQDARLFNFQDSLYAGIDNCEVFAMEVHPDSITQRAVDKSIKDNTRKILKQQLPKEEIERLKKIDEDLENEMIENLTLPELVQLKQARLMQRKTADKMPVFMDIFLYGLAQEKGKVLKGLERPDDQLYLMDTIFSNVDPMVIIKSWAKNHKSFNSIVDYYLKSDLQSVAKMVSLMPEEVEELMLTRRNQVMLNSMVQIMQEKSLFAVVGAAHLPGSNGLLKLLRQKGYTVTPIVGGTRTHARQYKRQKNAVEEEWFTVRSEEEGFGFEMPGKPVENAVEITGSKLYTYIDWKNNEQFFAMSATGQVLITDSNRQQKLTEALENSRKNLNGNYTDSIRPIEIKGLKGIEARVKAKDNFFRMIYLNKGYDLYILMVGMPVEAKLQSGRVTRFAESIVVLPKNNLVFSRFKDADNGFEIDFPGKPSTELLEKEGDENKGGNDNLQYYLRKGGAEFMVMVSKATNNYTFDEDEVLAESYNKKFKEETGSDSLIVKKELWKGLPSQLWQVKSGNTGNPYRVRLIHRGNRAYTIWYVSGQSVLDEAICDRFMGSFDLLPYKPLKTSKVVFDSVELMITGKQPDLLAEKKENEEADSSDIYVHYPEISTSLVVFRSVIDSLSIAHSDSDYVERVWVNFLRVQNPTVLGKKWFNHQGLKILQVQYREAGSHQYATTRWAKHGNRLLEWGIKIDSAGLHEVEPLLDAVRFQQKPMPLDLTRNNVQTILKTIENRHTEAEQNWSSRFGKVFFTRNELDDLLAAGLATWAWDTASYRSVQEAVWGEIKVWIDSTDADIAKLEKAYAEAPATGFAQQRIAELYDLADSKNWMGWRYLPNWKKTALWPGNCSPIGLLTSAIPFAALPYITFIPRIPIRVTYRPIANWWHQNCFN
ncbi:MAG: TraB/GumN family protein [Chitinophagaceae bacterium]|nr:TraB/GumN family protein [Chitinophagaceae bacterium]